MISAQIRAPVVNRSTCDDHKSEIKTDLYTEDNGFVTSAFFTNTIPREYGYAPESPDRESETGTVKSKLEGKDSLNTVPAMSGIFDRMDQRTAGQEEESVNFVEEQSRQCVFYMFVVFILPVKYWCT